jgi:hypothetical protein
MPMATSQPKNAAPTFAPPNRSRTPAGTAVIGPVGGSATEVSRTVVTRSRSFSTVVMRALFPVTTARKRRHGTMEAVTYEEEP